ncbi:MAG: septal ring lytic transglycosylase RlpA family protein [Methyloceanibacter sp.]|uniref:septal ring lytic transglycosylase RlpA family protein n=1 Tax=Methyloceanibacter sp. TaxID=1965321 RepID=UPI003EE28834
MTEREPSKGANKGDNRRAAMITVATFAALLLAVGLATFSDLPQNTSQPTSAAAQPSLPFGTKVAVETVDNGRTVLVRVDDRGPYADERVIDVSEDAAHKLGMVADGVTDVNVAPVPTDSIDDPAEPIE